MKRGFTLIELLVVIAIIAILAAILFPVFGKAREKARQTHCTNNQKSFATATQIYTQEHEETFPAAKTFWGDIRVDKGALKCMTMPAIPNGYMFNNLLSNKGLGEITVGGKIKDADRIWLTGDGMTPTTPPTWVTNAIPNVAYSQDYLDFPRHNNKAILSFADGHVDMLTLEQYIVLVKDGAQGGPFGGVDNGKTPITAGATAASFTTDFPCTFIATPAFPTGASMTTSDYGVTVAVDNTLTTPTLITINSTPKEPGNGAPQSHQVYLQPKPLVYDGFDTGTELNGLANGYGWSAGWGPNGGNGKYKVDTTSPITYQKLVTTPGYCEQVGDYMHARRTMNITDPAVTAYTDTTTGFGKDGTTLWMSFLLYCNNITTTKSVAFDSSNFDNSFAPTGLLMGNRNNQPVILDDPAGSSDPYSGKTPLNLGGTITGTPTLFYVARISFVAGNDTATVWLNPTINPASPAAPASQAATQTSNTKDMHFRSLHMYLKPGGRIDEIRIGASFASVFPISSW